MCGIAGFTRFHRPIGNTATLEKMGDSIRHRGPDASGTYLVDNVGLCHQRLSIIDLSVTGNQPMLSDDKQYSIVFNGEIYNFPVLRQEMQNKGYQFKSKTDTEVILALYQEYGQDCIHHLNGMFAIALWDNLKQELFLARDRLGKKPLYYYSNNSGSGVDIVFASEIKAILQVDNIPKDIRLDALYDYFTYQYIPDPKTIFSNLYKLEPGHFMLISKDGIKKQQYWDVSFENISTQSQQQLSEELQHLLRESTKSRMLSDVPLGAFLSGGVDSSVIVGLMAQQSEKPVTTCSIGFDSKKYDEVQYAQVIADQFSTHHHELTVKENVAAEIEQISAYFDEPFADPSLIPTYYVSKLAREKVTVAVAGDGGDENFAGYEKYSIDHTENKLRNLFPKVLRKPLFKPMANMMSKSNNVLFRKGHSLLNTLSHTPEHGFYISNAFCSDILWNRLASDKLKSSFISEGQSYHPSNISESYYHQADTDDHLSKILYTDIKTYLPGDILVKVDRMSMANSLEVRAPILDYKVVEFAAKVPSALKFHQGKKKYLLKESFKSMLPDDILYRKKMGFSVPLADWFRGEIKEFAQTRLFNKNTGIENFFKTEELRKIWQDHQEGRRDYSTILWSFLMFELWWQKYMDNVEL